MVLWATIVRDGDAIAMKEFQKIFRKTSMNWPSNLIFLKWFLMTTKKTLEVYVFGRSVPGNPEKFELQELGSQEY